MMGFYLNTKRESGVELLKVFALFGIVLCHTYTNFAYVQDYTNNNVTFFDSNTLKVYEYFIFQLIITLGYFGNMIFYVSSSWYLVDKEKNNMSKVISFIVKAIIISMLNFVFFYAVGENVNKEDLLKSIFPISNGVYWYITCYIIMYYIFPYINKTLNITTKKEHLSLVIGIFTIYFIISFFSSEDLFFVNKLITFISTYIIVSYIKKYKKEFCDNVKTNTIIFLSISFIFYSLIFINFAFVPIDFEWHKMNNPFFLFMSISALNIFKNIKFKNYVINTLSALSIFIYMIHGNFLFQKYITDKLAFFIMKTTGMDFIAIKIVCFAIILFLICAIVSMAFYKVFNSVIEKISIWFSWALEKIISLLI